MSSNTSTLSEPLWRPSKERTESSNLARFASWLVDQKVFSSVPAWPELHRWSVNEIDSFWPLLAKFLQTDFIKPMQPADPVFLAQDPKKHLLGSWFAGATINYAQNLLEHPSRKDTDLFCVCVNDSRESAEYTRAEIKAMVSSLQKWMKKKGIQKGDRVGGVVCNGLEAMAGFLACASIGAVWSSCSPDFGSQAVVDRFSALEPKLLIANLSVQYAGKVFDKTADLQAIASEIPSVETVLVSTPSRFVEPSWRLAGREVELASWQEAAGNCQQGSAAGIDYEELAFDDPLYVLFSSGTTGKPKCIVHAAGRALLQHQKELALHTDLKPGDRMLFFTTCGWMMWNWLVSAPSVGAVPVFFDGSPAYPSLDSFWETIEKTKVDVLGTSPKYIRSLMQQRFSPAHFAAGLKTLLSTGAPLLPEQFEWIYKQVKADLHVASISGGTDIVSCFMLGNPLLPVYAGELQSPGLGMAVDVWSEAGNSVSQTKDEANENCLQEGELVCTNPFISMPIGFWGDASQEKITRSYFSVYPGVWRHGDLLARNPVTGGFAIAGRSDATLNPGGVRIGTAELYRALEAIEEIDDCVALSDPQSADAPILLFVVLSLSALSKKGEGSSQKGLADLKQKIKKHVRSTLSPRHVPSAMHVVSKIPYTRSGKKVEVVLRKILAGEPASGENTLVDPTALTDFVAFQAARSSRV